MIYHSISQSYEDDMFEINNAGRGIEEKAKAVGKVITYWTQKFTALVPFLPLPR